jgi:ParB family protein of integrating conjugative element (PFGI_1 class)
MVTTSKASKTSKRPAAADIRGQLFEGNFGVSNNHQNLLVSDPVSITQLVLALKDIEGYDKNPRRIINPEYANIKASIRSQRSLNNPFNVTRRPGDPHYMVQSGGNTRLAILRELYAETGDEAFNTVHCLFVPWTTEAAVLTAHLVENELRGEMALIDKAYAIQELRSQLEHGQSALSDRAFVKAVADLGFKLSPRQVARLAYALELDRLIPKALRNSVSYRQLDTFKSTEKAYLSYCKGKTDQMPVLFAKHMAEHDGDSFDFDWVRQAIEAQLAGLIHVSSQRLSLEIDTLIFEDTSKQQVDALWSDDSQDDFGGDQASWPESWQAGRNEGLGKHKNKRHTHPSSTKEAVIDLPTLQQRGFALATGIAQAVGIAHLVLHSAEGLGFTVEKPIAPLENMTESAVWWLLCFQSGQETVETLGLPLMAYQVLNDPALLSNEVFNELVSLMALCRSAKK